MFSIEVRDLSQAFPNRSMECLIVALCANERLHLLIALSSSLVHYFILLNKCPAIAIKCCTGTLVGKGTQYTGKNF